MSKYWRPEPKARGLAFWSLLLPSLVYVIGTITYGLEAMKAGALLVPDALQSVGSALMVVGGELGTIGAAFEVFRKWQTERERTNKKGQTYVGNETTWADWVGLVVSIGASMGTLFIIYVRQTELTEAWVIFTLANGPWILLLCSVFDQAATVMELAFYRASFNRRWEQWNDDRHRYESAQATRATVRVTREPEPERLEPVEVVLPYQCDVCGERFATPQERAGHGNKHRHEERANGNGNGHKVEVA